MGKNRDYFHFAGGWRTLIGLMYTWYVNITRLHRRADAKCRKTRFDVAPPLVCLPSPSLALATHCWLSVSRPPRPIISSVSYVFLLPAPLLPSLSRLRLPSDAFFTRESAAAPPPLVNLPPSSPCLPFRRSTAKLRMRPGGIPREAGGGLVSPRRQRGMMRESGALPGWHNVTVKVHSQVKA